MLLRRLIFLIGFNALVVVHADSQEQPSAEVAGSDAVTTDDSAATSDKQAQESSQEEQKAAAELEQLAKEKEAREKAEQAEKASTTRKTTAPEGVFKPTEEISEDLPVPFPVNI